MKKITLLFIVLNVFAYSQIRITQYYNGIGNNRFIEITNVGNASVDLTSPQLYLLLYSEGAADNPTLSGPTGSQALSGSMAVGAVRVYRHSGTVSPDYTMPTTNANVICAFTGNDLVALSTSNSSTNGVAWAARTDVVGDGTENWGFEKSFSRNVDQINNDPTNFNISNWTEYTYETVNNAYTSTTNEKLGIFTGYSALPVELTSFTSTSAGNAITLNWATATEVDNYAFEVERSADNTTFTKVGFVAGAGNSNVQKQYSFVDGNLTSGTYYYRLKQVDTDGSFEYSSVVSSSVNETPATFSLEQNYPNPFNPSTKISFALAKDSDVQLTVFNTLGEEVAVLVNSTLTAGNHSVDFNATNLTSGMYLYKIQAGSFVATKKMLLTK